MKKGICTKIFNAVLLTITIKEINETFKNMC